MENAGVENLNLYEWTGGNPFYITEALAKDSEVVASSMKEAVGARTSKLSLETKELLNLISVIPSKVEIELLRRLFQPVEEPLDFCISKALLVVDRGLMSFRHELARLAVLDSIPVMKRIQLHQKVLQILLEILN